MYLLGISAVGQFADRTWSAWGEVCCHLNGSNYTRGDRSDRARESSKEGVGWRPPPWSTAQAFRLVTLALDRLRLGPLVLLNTHSLRPRLGTNALRSALGLLLSGQYALGALAGHHHRC